MTYYWDKNFIKYLDIDNIQFIVEVGARYGNESINLSKTFKNAIVYSFECNPKTVEICRKNLKPYKNIKFFDFGLGANECDLPFYSFLNNNDGASSLFKRIDFDKIQKMTGVVKIKTLKNILINDNIHSIDLLCMDVQGYELNVLKGCEDYLSKIKYIILEEPKKVINTKFLPENVYSKYHGAPSSDEIKQFMIKNNFIEIERLKENEIEDNVMYKNKEFNG